MMSRDRKSNAEAGIERLRRRLATDNPRFAKASAEEAEMDKFCTAVRGSLQAQRQGQRLHQEDIAARLDLTQSAISKIEAGRGDIGLRTLYRYARALGLRPVVTFVSDDEAGSKQEAGNGGGRHLTGAHRPAKARRARLGAGSFARGAAEFDS